MGGGWLGVPAGYVAASEGLCSVVYTGLYSLTSVTAACHSDRHCGHHPSPLQVGP